MSEEAKKMMVCDIALRPRIKGVPNLILAGTPFPEDIMDRQSKDVLLKQGRLKYVEDTPAEKAPVEDSLAEKAPVEDSPAKKKTASKKKDRGNKPVPTGFFHEDPEKLKEFNLDELDALHTQICNENGLKAPDPFESIEQGIAKLSGKS